MHVVNPVGVGGNAGVISKATFEDSRITLGAIMRKLVEAHVA